MTRRLKETEGRKLVLIGGSNIAFGVDGNLLEDMLREKGFDITVCPYGLYAAVGSSAMLELSEGAIHENDMVVLAFEPTPETLSDYFGATAFLKCAEGHPELFMGLSPDLMGRAAGNLVPYIQEKAAVCASGVLPRAEGVYAAGAFDGNCTMVFERPGNRMRLGYDTSSPVDLDKVSISGDFARRVNRYCERVQKKGAQVFMSFSPMNRSSVRGSMKDFFDRMNRAFVCPVISDPNDYCLESGWFYDSNFHLNSAGQMLRTILLAEDLLPCLGCYSAVDAARPEMPAPVVLETGTAEEGVSADFVFEPLEQEGLCRLTGLTEAGRDKEALAVPEKAEGRVVAEIDAHALQAPQLRELTVPGTVDCLPDHFLEGCPNLERLVLTHTEAPCSISSHSLDGADNLQILVPYSVYPWYRDGYGCESNPWEAWVDRIATY